MTSDGARPNAHSRSQALASFIGLVSAVAATMVGWQVVSRGVDNALWQTSPEIALAIRSDDARALANLADRISSTRTDEEDDDAHARALDAPLVRELTSRALSSEPMSVRALRGLAQSAERSGNQPEAEQLMAEAGSRSIRDIGVNLWLIRYSLNRQDFARSLYYANALLCTWPYLLRELMPALILMAEKPGARDPFVDLMRTNPPWRKDFFIDYVRNMNDASVPLEIFQALKGTAFPPKDEELRAYLEQLIFRNMVDKAYYVWLQFLPKERLKQIGYLYNGNFDLRLTNLPFDWVIKPVDGATIEFAEIPGEPGKRALHVEFTQKRVPFQNVTQMLVLAAGTYKLTGRYRAYDLNNRRGMTWRIYCAQRPDDGPIAGTERVSGTTMGWKEIALKFDIPEDDCSAQWLRLELAARVGAEEEVSGGIWYDNLKIDKFMPNAASAGMPISPPIAGTAFERAIRRK